MLLFLSVGPSLAQASSVDYNSEISIEEAKDLVEQGYYGSVDDAIFFESMSEEEYDSYLKEFESTFVDENGIYSASYMDDESVDSIEEEVVFIEDESEWELIEGEYDPDLIPKDGEYQLNLGWLLPAAKAVVKSQGGKKVVKQFLKKTTKWIKVVNGKLAGKKHPKTGVKYNKNGFPVFPRQYQSTLPTSYLKSTVECRRMCPYNNPLSFSINSFHDSADRLVKSPAGEQPPLQSQEQKNRESYFQLPSFIGKPR